VIEIDFAVEDAVRGVSGGTYLLREWAGLWPAGDQPFHMGQRFLMLLHAASAAGLSSPVGGMDGAIPIRGSSQLAGPQATLPAATLASGDAEGLVVDLRWIATRVVRAVSYSGPTRQSTSRSGPAPAAAEIAISATPAETIAAPITQKAAYATVLAMLRGWDRVDHAAR
jgi:hypothetical protein